MLVERKRKLLTIHNALHPRNDDRLYVKRKKRGKRTFQTLSTLSCQMEERTKQSRGMKGSL